MSQTTDISGGPTHLAPGAVLRERYEIGRELGRGGMSVVFEADDRRLKRTVAIKVLRPEIVNPQSVSRFLDEGANAARFVHRNVVTTFDVGEAGGHPFLVMERLFGETLAARLDRAAERRLSVEEALDVLLPVLDAVAEAHGAGIVHRDLKPDNVFLAKRGGAVEPVVLDFGIAKALVGEGATERGQTATGQIVGTPLYMSPEQASGAKGIGGATDQYALGVVLYECLSGRHPMGDVGQLEMLQLLTRIAYSPPDPLRVSAPWVSAKVAGVVDRMLSKDPAGRYANLRDAAEALLAARGAPHASEPPSPAPLGARTTSRPAPTVRLVEPARPEEALGPSTRGRAPGWPVLVTLVVLGLGATAWYAWHARPGAPPAPPPRAALSNETPRPPAPPPALAGEGTGAPTSSPAPGPARPEPARSDEPAPAKLEGGAAQKLLSAAPHRPRAPSNAAGAAPAAKGPPPALAPPGALAAPLSAPAGAEALPAGPSPQRSARPNSAPKLRD
jgi:hypothetical protein